MKHKLRYKFNYSSIYKHYIYFMNFFICCLIFNLIKQKLILYINTLSPLAVYFTVFFINFSASVFCQQQIKLALVICMRVWCVCVPAPIACQNSLPFPFAAFHFHFRFICFLFPFHFFLPFLFVLFIKCQKFMQFSSK